MIVSTGFGGENKYKINPTVAEGKGGEVRGNEGKRGEGIVEREGK